MKIYTLFMLCMVQFALAQNAYNSNGKRHGKWSGVYKDTNNLRYEGEFNDGKEVGIFYLYDNTKNKVVISTRDFTANNGVVVETFLDQKGNKVSEGSSINGKKTGKWVYYFKDSNTIMSEENYANGLLEGESKTFYKNGKLLEHKYYKNNALHGKYQRFTEQGNLLHNLNYAEGKLNGLGEYYSSTGKIYTKGEYKDNIKVGHWPVFDKNGKEVSVSKTQITNPKRTAKSNANKTK
ncbi:hypothetical protein K5I29_06465 [Flavobacterium agricola]|uniref:Antitoxin component YwqK of YwqJK toxin-antitoxin module n=1 Tax=Flavobacterium agricola TaxID=2870839 RepID=A0ABY6M5A4_9FLAO|nr:hypothetical protein [Flavobacterium agricola]UYW02513.1 hypothetical protein K5I29_06465 [Flavobacterium agricola]